VTEGYQALTNAQLDPTPETNKTGASRLCSRLLRERLGRGWHLAWPRGSRGSIRDTMAFKDSAGDHRLVWGPWECRLRAKTRSRVRVGRDDAPRRETDA